MAARKLGYLRDDSDPRDRLYRTLARQVRLLSPPREVDFRDKVTVLNQDNLGACVANAGFGAIQTKHRLDGIEDPLLGNRLHGYWGARAYDNNIEWDAGSKIRNFFRFINSAGFMPEAKTKHGYDITTFAKGPSRAESRLMYDQKNKMQGQVRYYRIDDEGSSRKLAIKTALANKCPVEFGTSVNEAFLNHRGPGPITDFSPPFIGGHAMYLVGYNDEGAWNVNSWDVGWGEGGIALISWDYLLSSLTHDIWVVERAPYYSEQ